MSVLVPWILEYAVNSVWMVPLIVLAAWAAARVMRRVDPAAEHAVWVVALLLEAVLPACRVPLYGALRAIRGLALWSWGLSEVVGDGHVDVSMGPAHVRDVTMRHDLMTWLAATYGCITLYFAARLIWGIWRTVSMKRSSVEVEFTGATQSMWKRSCLNFGIADGVVAESHEIPGPVTVGILRGVLLLPRGFLDRAEGGDLEAVMAHECAHMHRWDFAKNLLYNAVSLPVAYHPLLWLTKTRVAESREMVCDAMAADAVEGREKYAQSLLRLASMIVSPTPARPLHAIGILDAKTFERRVMSLTRKKAEIGGALRLATIAACVGIGAVTCASALALRMEVATSAPVPAENNRHGAVKVEPGVMAASAIYQKHPVYPADAKANHDTIDGPVVMEAIISKDGTVENLRVVKGLREDYNASAIDAVREWRYKPYLLNGEPVEVETTITVTYYIGK